MREFLIKSITDKRVLGKCLLLMTVIFGGILAMTALLTFIELGTSAASASVFINYMADLIFGLQTWLWVGLVVGLACAVFFNYFSRFFGVADLPIEKEIDSPEDIKAQTLAYDNHQKLRARKFGKLVIFNIVLAGVALLMMLVSMVMMQF